MSERPLLLHSLEEFSCLIFPCLEALRPTRVLEIGSEAATFTQALCEWGRPRDVTVACIEPHPLEAHRELSERHGLQVIQGKSPEALDHVPRFDAYIIDGDHNHWIVSNELERIFEAEGEPLVIAHEMSWPWARRDLYYEPADIPACERQPFVYDGGVTPGVPGVVDGGFRGEGAFAYAAHEGGEQNGVLTAVEDVMQKRPGLELLRVPCLFGLGFLFPSKAPWAPKIRELVGPFNNNDLLERLERNRLALFLALIDPLGPVVSSKRGCDALVSSLRQEIEDLQEQLGHLRLAELTGEDRDRSSPGE